MRKVVGYYDENHSGARFHMELNRKMIKVVARQGPGRGQTGCRLGLNRAHLAHA